MTDPESSTVPAVPASAESAPTGLPSPGGPPSAPPSAAPARQDDVDKRRKEKVELAGAIVIGIAAVLTALATFWGSQADGEADRYRTMALDLTLDANDLYNDANAQEAIERDWIFSWLTEAQNGTDAADYLEVAMPDEVWALADEWQSSDDDIIDPFSEDAAMFYPSYSELWSQQLLELGDDSYFDARCALFETQVADTQSEAFGVAVVVLAISLVVGGVAALLQSKPAQLVALSAAVLALVFGALMLVAAADTDEAREVAAEELFEGEEGIAPGEELAVVGELCRALG